MAEDVLVLRVTRGELEDLEDGLDVSMEERLESYRRRMKFRSRYEAAPALKDHRRVARLCRTMGKPMAAEGSA